MNPAADTWPAPFMYDHDLEEDEPPVGCDHGFPEEVESEDDEG